MSSSRHPPDPADATPDPTKETATEGKPRRRGWGPFRFVLAYTRGLIVDQHLRRQTMFYVVIAAMLMFFAGVTFLEDWLDGRHHLARFAVYWMICGWLTILAALLAIYDLLLLRIQHRLLRRQLRERFLGDQQRREQPDREEP